ncbi:TatD family hydrolase [Bacteroidota bacterium]
MIDTHAHIDFNAFDEDRKDIIERAFNSGVEYIIIPGVEPKDFSRLLELTQEYKNLYCGMGVHPHNAKDADKVVFNSIRKNADNHNVKAIGETGIDYYYDFAPKDLQQAHFRNQLKIAKETGLPAIVHNREADEDVLRIIEDEQDGSLKGVLHCFSSPPETLNKALELGFNISFTGNITFKKSNLDEVVRDVPLDRLMLETDSPFMTPVPLRGKRNEPANVKYIAQKIAELKSISFEEVIDMTSKTAKKLFNLSIFLLAFLLAFSMTSAQSILDDIAEVESPEEELIHPYKKFIGFGPVFGTNTVVETYFLEIGEKDVSYDGLFAIGGAITYGVFDYLVVEAAYNYSKNTKIVEEQDGLIDPSIYQNFEISTHWIINPYSRVNFFGTLGATAFFNSFNNVPNNQIGWNAGLGFYVNIPSDYGLFNIVAEWKINFETERKTQLYWDYSKKTQEEKDTKSFYSIPRVTILYYPPFFDN